MRDCNLPKNTTSKSGARHGKPLKHILSEKGVLKHSNAELYAEDISRFQFSIFKFKIRAIDAKQAIFIANNYNAEKFNHTGKILCRRVTN